MRDGSEFGETAGVGAVLAPHDAVRWRCHTLLRKFRGDSADIADLLDELSIDGNLLMYGGASAQWETLLGNGTGTGGQTLTYFNNANAYIGVGDSSTSEAATHTDLQAASNKLRKAMDATYPTHTDGTTSGSASVVFRSTFATGDANYAWNEWGVFNGSSGGRMLNRKVQSLGTKTSAASWQLTVTLTLS